MKSKKNSKRENRWLKCRQQIRRTGILLMGMLLVSTSAYASEPTIVTGTRRNNRMKLYLSGDIEVCIR